MAARVKKQKKASTTFCVCGVNGEDEPLASLFIKEGWERTFSFFKADVVVFVGTGSIHPIWVGEHSIVAQKAVSFFRDKREVRLFKQLPHATRKIGINRGALLVNVLSGGGLWQQADNHEKNHKVTSMDASFNKNHPVDGEQCFHADSAHSQIMKPHENSLILAEAQVSDCLQSDRVADYTKTFPEPEVVYHWQTNALSCQYNPATEELTKARNFFLNAVHEYLMN